MITDGMAKIIGDGASLYYFLVNKHAKIKQSFYALEQDQDIRHMMQWFQRTMRRNTSILIRKILNPRKGNHKESMAIEHLNEDLDEFMEMILPKINSKLTKTTYVTGPKITIIDIMIYCDIQTILKLYKREIENSKTDLTAIKAWYDSLSEHGAIQRVNK